MALRINVGPKQAKFWTQKIPLPRKRKFLQACSLSPTNCSFLQYIHTLFRHSSPVGLSGYLAVTGMSEAYDESKRI